MNPNTEPILDAANKFLWSDGMQESLDTFATNYAEMFVGVRRRLGEELLGEQRLEWTEAHKEVRARANSPAHRLSAWILTYGWAPSALSAVRVCCTVGRTQFSELFEFHLEQFLETQPFSTEDFVEACKDALEHGSWDGCGRTVQVVLSMIEYDSFVALMVDKAEEQALEAAMGALGDAEDDEAEEAPREQYGGGDGGGYDGGGVDCGGGGYSGGGYGDGHASGAYGGGAGYGDADAEAGGVE